MERRSDAADSTIVDASGSAGNLGRLERPMTGAHHDE
jgi:hypothetical protein